jgi:hypothetical protein
MRVGVLGSGVFADTAAFAELIVLAVKGTAANKALCMLYCIPGFTRDRWSHAFKLLK